MIRTVIAASAFALPLAAGQVAPASFASYQDPGTVGQAAGRQVAGTQAAGTQAAGKPVEVSVRGRVLDDAFAPAAGVPILQVTGKAPDVRAALKSPIGKSGADGRFAVRVTIDPEQSNALLLGGRKFAVRRCRLSKTELDVDLGTFAMPRGFFATGRIRTADGKPLEGAVVVGSDLLDTREFLGHSRYRQKSKCWTSVPVAANGIFMLPGMVRSAGEILITCPGYYDAKIAPVAMGTPLDVSLVPAETARGTVVDTSGVPLAGIAISIGAASTKSAEDGSWSVTRRTLGARKARAWSRLGGTYKSASATLPDNGNPCEIELDVTPSTAAPKHLRVRAEDQNGDTLQEFEALISWNQGNQLRYRPDALLIGKASRKKGAHKSATDGEAALPEPGRSSEDTGILFVRAEGHAWTRVEVDPDAAGGEPVVAKLSPPLAVAGTVLDKVTDKPLANVNVIVTPKTDDHTRDLFSKGFWNASKMLGPYSTTTGTDGKWSAKDLGPGEYDVFLMIGGKIVHTIDRLEVTDASSAAKLQDLDCKIAGIQTLRGKIEGATQGLQIRAHWHRPSMSSSSWNTEYDGAVAIADDGTFELPNLAPVTWRPELLLPIPPRGGLRRKLTCETWDASNPPKKPYRDTAKTILQVTGRVDGEIPWHRLAVLGSMLQENNFYGSFAPPGTIAMLAPDRTFRIQLPPEKLRLILFDVFSGVAFAWRDVEATDLSQPINWSGKAVPLAIAVPAAAADAAHSVKFSYVPDEDHWPMPRHDFNFNDKRSGMTATFATNQIPQLWLPARSGTIEFVHNNSTATIDASRLRNGKVQLKVAPDSIEVRPDDG